MNRREMIKATLLAAGAATAQGAIAEEVLPSGQKPPQQKHSYPLPPRETNGERMPNVLWVITDQQRFDTLGALGNPLIHTPNLDRFAAESVTFNNAFVQCPICAPSRGSLLTGRYPNDAFIAAPGSLCVTRVHGHAPDAFACAGRVSFYGNIQTGELYDLQKDPGEFNNLWNSSLYKDVQAQMMQLLATRMIGTVDPLPERVSFW